MKKYIIVSPCFNEEKVIESFLNDVEKKLRSLNNYFDIIIVDDASTDSSIEILRRFKFTSIYFTLHIIRLNFNSGHQEAIRQGLIYAQEFSQNISGIIVMDSDGQDDPTAIIELLKIENFDICFIARKKRTENLKFKLGYILYKLIFRVSTGKAITFGNYSIISANVLKHIQKQHFFHYAAFLSKQKFEIKLLYFDRQKRLGGNSKMNYENLIIHGLKSIIEFSDNILILLLKIFLIIFFLTLGLGIFVLYAKFISGDAVLGWTSSLGIGLINGCLIILGTIILGLLILSVKNSLIQDMITYEEIK